MSYAFRIHGEVCSVTPGAAPHSTFSCFGETVKVPSQNIHFGHYLIESDELRDPWKSLVDRLSPEAAWTAASG
jgi:hypothetical protein